MRPLFPFYGSKWRDAKRYGPPTDHVIEPFKNPCGAMAPEALTMRPRDPSAPLEPGDAVSIAYDVYSTDAILLKRLPGGWWLVAQITDSLHYADSLGKLPTYEAAEEFIVPFGEPLPPCPATRMIQALR